MSSVKLEIPYIAGLFDGEGTVGIYAQFNGTNNKTYWSCKLSIVGTHKPMIEALYNYFNLGQLSTQKRQKDIQTPSKLYKCDSYKQSWRWCLSRKQEIKYVCELIYPYLIEKSEQVKIVMDYCDNKLDGKTASELCKNAKRFHFDKELGEPSRRSTGSYSELNSSSKLTYEKAENIRKLYIEGTSQSKLVKLFGVSKCIISRVISNKTYVHKHSLLNNYQNP